MQNKQNEHDVITISSNSLAYWSFKWLRVIFILIICISFLVMVHNGKFNAIIHHDNEDKCCQSKHQCNYQHE